MAWGTTPHDFSFTPLMLGNRPQGVVHESSRIRTNLIQIREIRVNLWTVTSGWVHLAFGHLEDRGWGGALSCLDGRRGGFRVARRARSWPAARGADGFRGRGRRPPGGRGSGASRRHETALCAVHESPRARDTKASGPLVETRKRSAPLSIFKSLPTPFHETRTWCGIISAVLAFWPPLSPPLVSVFSLTFATKNTRALCAPQKRTHPAGVFPCHFAVSSVCRGKPGIHGQKTMDSRQRSARVGVARWRVEC